MILGGLRPYLLLFQILIHGIGRQKAHRALDGVLAVFVVAALITVVEHARKVGHVVIQRIHIALRELVGRLAKVLERAFVHRLFIGVAHQKGIVIQADEFLLLILLAECGIGAVLDIDGREQMQDIVLDAVAHIAGAVVLADRGEHLFVGSIRVFLREHLFAQLVDVRLEQQGVRQARAVVDHH